MEKYRRKDLISILGRCLKNIMAFNDQEIEIKTPVSRGTFLKIRKYLQKNSKFIKCSKQIDTYYTPLGGIFLKPRYPYEWLSLRQRDMKITVNYKHWYPEGSEATTFCDEFETEIKDLPQFKKILSALKFEEIITVKKDREIYVKNKMEISLDKVSSLGYFIEIELLKYSSDVEKSRKELLDFAGQIGVDKIINVSGGYAAALMRKKKIKYY